MHIIWKNIQNIKCHFHVCIYSTPLPRARCNTRSIFKRSKAGFYPSWLVPLLRLNHPICPIIYPEIEENWSINTFPRGICTKWNKQLRPGKRKLCHWATNPYRTHVTSNQLVMLIVRPINLNVFWKLHRYSLQRTRSPPGFHLPKSIGNTHPRNCYNLKGNDIDVQPVSIIPGRHGPAQW